MKQLLAICFAILLAGRVLAEWPYDAVCDVVIPLQSGDSAGGSGTLLGVSEQTGLVLTCWHVVEGGRMDSITCTFPATGSRHRGRLIGSDSAYDLAAIEIENPPEIATPVIARARRDEGPFVCAGFPWNGGGRLRTTVGDYMGFPQGQGVSSWAPSMLHTRTHVISGYSGGARFNKHGEYVGVISGMTGDSPQNMDRTWGAGGDALERFVDRFLKRGQP